MSDERPPVRWGAVALAAAAAVWAVVPYALATQGLGYLISVDALLLLLLVIVLPRARWVALAGYAALLAWEVVRSVGASLMDQDPLLYDLLYLIRHFVVLGRDLLGGALVPVVLGVGVALLCGAAVGVFLLDRGRHGPRSEWVGGVLGLALIVWAAGGPARFSTVALGKNLVASAEVGSEVGSLIRAADYDRYTELSLTARPDLHVYVVESYGRILHQRKGTRQQWEGETRERERALRKEGYAAVSAFATAPVSGGRSWLADASLLTGRTIAHESVFNEVMAQVDGMVHLPGLLASAGYETILVRPKDRARAGVELRNDLDFQHTVFFDELAYEGPAVGWGWIPDQYTLGWLREHRLGDDHPDGPPRFVFAHLVSSHAPWHVVPEKVDDWHTLATAEAPAPLDGIDEVDEVHEADARGAWEELWVQLGRYQRREGHRGKRKATVSHVQRYAKAVSYDLDVLTEHVLALPERPAVIVLLGDHQPPLVTRDDDFDVPIHVLARDPALLEPLRRHGFVPGWEVPASAAPVARLEGLMSLLLHQLAAADGQDLPVWRGGVPGR